MKYALWNLNFENPNYGTGPEESIQKAGGEARAFISNGAPENGADILGYIAKDFSKIDLSFWNYREMTQSEALTFAKSINENFGFDENGYLILEIAEAQALLN